jgi:hypothetical protein
MGDRNIYPLNTAGRGSEAGTRKVLAVRNAPTLAADVALNRTVGLLVAPAGFVVTGFTFTISDVDTGGSPTHAFSIGVVGTPALIAAIATTGQAGGTLTTLAAAGNRFKFGADTEIIMTSTTGAATAAAGTVSFELEGYME